MGRLLRAKLGAVSVLSLAGSESCIVWLSPTGVSQYTDDLLVRVSEPCNRGAFKTALQAFVFPDVVSGTHRGLNPVAVRVDGLVSLLF